MELGNVIRGRGNSGLGRPWTLGNKDSGQQESMIGDVILNLIENWPGDVALSSE